MAPIGIQLYSVREQMKEDFLGVLKKMAEFGYAGVELGGSYGREPAEVKKILDDLGLRVSSTHFALATEDTVNEVVDRAGLFGCKVVVSGWRAREDWDRAEAIPPIGEAYQRSAELLAAHGLTQAYHNHWWELQDFDGRRGLEIFLDSAPAAQSELDVYWACRFGEVDVPAFLGTWASRCPLLHVKDGPLIQGQPHTAVGAGKMDIPAVVGAADADVLQWLIVELDDCATDMLTAVRESVEYLVANGLGEGRP